MATSPIPSRLEVPPPGLDDSRIYTTSVDSTKIFLDDIQAGCGLSHVRLPIKTATRASCTKKGTPSGMPNM